MAVSARRVAEVVERLLEISVEQRPQVLADLCGDDFDLRREVESLLGFQEKATDFIERPAYQMAAGTLVELQGGLQAGERLGDYRIISLIGEGGMGEVYLAEDTQLGRRVAIKLLKFGLGTVSLVRRFQQEERILAGLTHPNIARLYGGALTANGLPYFVMEFVEGARLDDYYREKHRPSGSDSIPARLELFRKICSAVAYAHQHLVVHRDLKPANIRVTAEGEPKLLDFGIAKLLDPATSSMEVTMTFAAVMTPEYGSPEQARGENITTASDVYSLGVILYELLTSQKPFKIDKRTPAAMAQAITEQQPTKPSATATRNSSDSRFPGFDPRVLRGDLDNIVLKALRKEPERRYASVVQFAEDIGRYLEGRPVIARKDTFGYRSAKFVKRNRLGVAAAGLIILSLIGGIIATAWEAHRANRRFNDVRRLANSLMFEIHDSVKDLQGSTPTRRLIVTRALEYLDSLAAEAGNNAALKLDLATAYEKVGDIQGNPFSANLGDTDGALASYRKALAIREALLPRDSSVAAQMALGRSYRSLADIFEQKGDIANCVASYRRSLSIFEKLGQKYPNEFSVQDELARAYESLADGLSRAASSGSERLDCYKRSLSIRQSLYTKNNHDAKLRRSLAITFLKIGAASDPKDPGTTENIKHGIGMLEALAREDPNNERARREVGFAYYQLGVTQVAAGDFVSALESRRKAFAIREEIAAEDPKNTQARFDLGVAHGDLAEAFSVAGKSQEAIEHAQQALSILQELSAADPTNAVYQRNIGLCYEKFAQTHERLGHDEARSISERINHWTEAREWYRKGFELFSTLRDRGTLMPADFDQPQKFAAKTQECEDAIAGLKK